MGVLDRNAGRGPRRGEALWNLRKKNSRGDVHHTFLTSLVDQNGTLRVQYMGVKFNPQEMLRDLQSLIGEAKAR
jgi:cytochrome oxidase Cu insertion factor (SCO1/SenC/PrrC family)